MPYNAQQIPVLDLRPGRAIGVALPFNGPACFKSTYTTSEAVKANLIDWFLSCCVLFLNFIYLLFLNYG